MSTPQMTTKNVLQDSENIAQTILDNLPDMVIIHQNGKVLYVNPELTKTAGYRPEEMVGKNVLDYVVDEYKQTIIDSIQKRIGGGTVGDYEAGFKLKNGGTFMAVVRGTPIIFHNEPAVLAVLINITDRLKGEENLKNVANQLQEKVSELEKFKQLTIGRELKMVEMKKELDELKAKLAKSGGNSK